MIGLKMINKNLSLFIFIPNPVIENNSCIKKFVSEYINHINVDKNLKYLLMYS